MSRVAGNSIFKNIQLYKRKYYLNFLMRSGLLALTFLLSAFLFYSLLEFFGNFNTVVRTIFFYSYLVMLIYVFLQWILFPLLRIYVARLQISDQKAARDIGNSFPSINDKLLNLIQLYNKHPESQSLVKASILQKSKEMDHIQFERAVSFSKNKKYLYYLAYPFAIVLLLGISFPRVFSESTTRIVHYNTEFTPDIPFRFVLENKRLLAYKNEDFDIQVSITGQSIPEHVYLKLGERRIKLFPSNNNDFSYTLKKIAKDTEFEFEAAGYSSPAYELKVVNRPNVKNFNVELTYPGYLNMENERLSNVGTLQVPAGTQVTWHFQTLFTDSVYLLFDNEESPTLTQLSENQTFTTKKNVYESGAYEVVLGNIYTRNKDRIIYQINVTPDEFPEISVNQYTDTILYDYMILGGNISDDYGFSDLYLNYKIIKGTQPEGPENQARHNIPIDPSKNNQAFYFNWDIDSLLLKDSDQIEFYLVVRDNDAIHGRKASRSGLFYFRMPDRDQVNRDLERSSQSAKNQIDKSLEMVRELNEKIEEAEDRMKGKKDMNWQDQKLLEDLITDKENIDNEIIKLQKLNEANNMKLEKFNELDADLIKKVDQLQQLMDELLDEETKKLFEELKKLLEEKKDLNEVKSLLERIDFRQDNFEQELERTLELFKRMKFEIELEKAIQEIDKTQDLQKQLSEETEDRTSKMQDLIENQQELNEDFQDVRESIENLIDQNQDLAFPKPLENTFDQEQSIEKSQRESLEYLNENKRKRASEAQHNAAESMEELSESMKKMQANGQMQGLMEDYNSLRLIIDNLLKLSFSQEDIMIQFKNVNQSDPRFISLSQKQLTLKDDAKVIEDSLMALSQRVFQISSFITREVNQMNLYMDESLTALRERKKAQAIGKQQFSMTSMNNLALLLDDVLSAMQQQLAMAMGIPSQSQSKGEKPSMSELQQRLNEQISELKKSGKEGKQLSEELAKLAAGQEEIRRRLREEEEKMNNMNGNGEKLGEIAGKMEQTEIDLVNKRLTAQLIQRQEEILTRLLQAEDAMREQELDEEREATSAKQLERTIPPEFEEYLKLKEKEIELLRTVPPKLNPYYKKEVNEYFNRLETSYK